MFRSFRTQLTLLFGSLALLMAAALSIELGDRLTEQAKRERGDALRHLAQGAALMLAEGLQERIREVELLARSNEVRRIGLDAAAWPAEIERLRSGRPHYAWIGVTDVAGKVVAASDGLLVGADVSKRPWFAGASQAAFVGDVHAAKLLASLLPAATDGEPLRFIDFAAPLRDAQGRPLGVLGVHANWRWARDVIALMHSEDARDAGVQVLILDRQGNVIHDAHGPTAYAATAASAVAAEPQLQRWFDGHYLTVAAAVPARTALTDLGWVVVARQPAAEALADARAAQRSAWVAGLVVALAAMALVWISAGRFSRPLARIAIAADRIEAGERDVVIPVTRSTVELEQVSSSLARMTRDLVDRGEALEQANRQLEDRVRERTAELAQANEQLGRINAELDNLAHSDGLTGLANRRAADQMLAKALAHHRRHMRPLGVLLADIDHFKRINDTHGHEAGDRVLRAVAACLRDALRESDVPARFGGEEFLIVLPETDLAGVEQVAEKLRRVVAALAMPEIGRITASFGGAVAENGRERPEALLKRADAALYAAKEAGRNRLELAGAPASGFHYTSQLLEEAG